MTNTIRTTTLDWRDINVGDEVTPLEIPVTATVIVAGAIASRDFMPVHHDPEFAKKQGSPNMFMNILTTNGLCVRFLTDWAGPEAMVTKLAIRLGVPSFPNDPLRFTGSVTGKSEGVDGEGFVEVTFKGSNSLGDHVSGTATISLLETESTMSSLGGKAAIAGIGQTEFSKESGRSELQLACEAVKAAIDDAGLRPSDIDGMVTFTMDSSDEIDIARNVGIGDLTFFSRVHHGGGAAAGTVVQAAMAVATGTANAVVCYRAFNERSGFRFGGSTARPTTETPMFMANYAPFGLLTPAAWVALHAQRYMSTYGVTNEDFGRISVVDRAHAARNPDAWFYERPITLEDHQNSRWVIEPVLRLLDCCQESDGGVALVITSVERARDLPRPPAVITAAVQGAAADGEMMTSYYRDDITGLPEMGVVAEKLWRDSGLEALRHPDRVHLRPLHTLRLRAARGARLLRSRGGQGLRDRREAFTRRCVADQHERRPARRGVYPRDERHHRGRPPGAWNVIQPGRQCRACAGDLRYRSTHERTDSRAGGLTGRP